MNIPFHTGAKISPMSDIWYILCKFVGLKFQKYEKLVQDSGVGRFDYDYPRIMRQRRSAE